MQVQVKANTNSEKNIMSQLWFRYFPYWPLFLVLLVICLAGAWIYLRYSVPQFASSATILIKDEKKGIDDSKMIESLNLISNKKIVENEIEVIRSRSLMSEVVKNLGLYAPVFTKNKWTDRSAYATSPVRIEAKTPDSITDVKEVFFSYDSATAQVIIQNRRYPLNQWINTPYGILKFKPANGFHNAYQFYYFSLVNPKAITLNLIGKLNVTAASKLSSVINIKLKDEVPSRAEDILNELVLAYNRAAINDKNSLAANTLSFIEERLNFVSHELDSVEHRIQQYKANKGAVDISSQGRLFLENVSVNDQKMSDVNMQLAVLNQVEKYVLSKDNKGGIVPSTLGIGDPLLTTLLNKLYDAELQYDKLKKTVAENNPMLVAVSDQIEKVKPGILENIQSQRRSLEASKSNLHSTNNAYSSVLQSIPKKERDLVEISRQQNIQGSIYSFLLQKREEAALSYSSSVADHRVIDMAQASLSPISPNKKLIYLIAVVMAMGIGVALVSGRELFSRKVLYRQEIESLTTIPVISEIGYERSKDPIVIGEGKTSLIAEQFRKLRTSLSFININNKHRKLLITSTISGEGKSFVAVNLGLSLAMSGKKIVLVEFDMKNPDLSEKLGMMTDKGLSSYLTGEAEPEEVIKRTATHENLFIISAGALPPNPSELILNEKVPDLLSYLEGIFDCVIIDTAPVGAMADAYVLAPMCDATLYIVRHRHTTKIVIERLDETNKINELKNMVIVFNGVQPRGFSKDNNGYGYGYVYFQKQKKKKKLVN